MTGKKIIAVVGATGQQGGGLAHAILDDPDGEFALRALTRNADSPAAKDLAARGAEVVAVSVDDEESLRAALEGAYGAYFVTAFWEYNDVAREQQQARAMVNAAKATGLRHVIWSTLPDTREHLPADRVPTLHGSYKTPHFDSKAEIDGFFREAGVPATFLSTTLYFDSFLSFLRPQRGADGKLAFAMAMGDSKLPGIASEDIGRTAYGIFQHGTDLIGETISISGENLTGAEYAAKLTELLGEEVTYVPISAEDVRASGAPGADDLANMFVFYSEHADFFAGARDPEYVRTLNPRLKDFSTWLAAHRDEFGA